MEEEYKYPAKIMKMKLYVIDLNENLTKEYLEERLKQVLNTSSINCVVHFSDFESRDIEWYDSIDLNKRDSTTEMHEKYFE